MEGEEGAARDCLSIASLDLRLRAPRTIIYRYVGLCRLTHFHIRWLKAFGYTPKRSSWREPFQIRKTEGAGIEPIPPLWASSRVEGSEGEEAYFARYALGMKNS